MDISEGFVTSVDGTRVATYSGGRPDGPVLVLTHGLGGSMAAWRHFIHHFQGRFRILSWDYRGLYRSAQPAGASATMDFSIARHCDDLMALLDAEGVKKAVFLGWSMGVQVNLEFYRRAPERFAGMVLINGTAGKPFETAFRGDWLKAVMPYVLNALDRSAPMLTRVTPYTSVVAKTRAIVALAKASGLCSPTLDEDVFLEISRDFVHLDFLAYSRTFRELGQHDATAVVDQVRVPTLAITGEKDLFTPLETSQSIVDRIPGAELMVVRGGTHYTPVEFPMVVNLRIEKFLREKLGLE